MFLLYFGQVVEEIGIFARELRPRGFFGSKFSQVVYADKRGQRLLVEVVAESVGTEPLAVNLFAHKVVLFCLTLAALSAVLHRNVQQDAAVIPSDVGSYGKNAIQNGEVGQAGVRPL